MPMTRRAFACLIGGLTISCAAFAAQTNVSQIDKTFDPDELTRKVGDSLHINNDDTIPHNVLITGANGANQNRGVQKPGESVDVALDTVGDYTIRCGIHPKMKLIVHVN